MALRVTHDWLALASDDSAEAAAWGALRIDLGEPFGCLTRAEDLRAKTVTEEVVGAVLPLASWLARKWLLVFCSGRVEPPVAFGRRERYEWSRSHCLRYVGDGTVLPDLTFEAAGTEAIRMRWNLDRPEATRPLRFLVPPSSVTLRRGEVEAAFEELVQGVVARLCTLAPDHPETSRLVADWSVARDSGHADHRGAMLAARAGLDWSLLAEDARARWRGLATTQHPLFESALSALPPDSADEASRLADGLVKRALGSREDSSWSELRQRVGVAGEGLPWEVGWECAHRLRSATQQPHDRPFIVSTPDTQDVHVDVDSAVAMAHGRAPVRLVAARHKDNRFREIRDIWPILFAPDRNGITGSVFSSRCDVSQSVARAFSAELLAPIAAIRKLVTDEVEEEDISWIADALGGAPDYCVRHQLENHDLLARS